MYSYVSGGFRHFFYWIYFYSKQGRLVVDLSGETSKSLRITKMKICSRTKKLRNNLHKTTSLVECKHLTRRLRGVRWCEGDWEGKVDWEEGEGDGTGRCGERERETGQLSQWGSKLTGPVVKWGAYTPLNQCFFWKLLLIGASYDTKIGAFNYFERELKNINFNFYYAHPFKVSCWNYKL